MTEIELHASNGFGSDDCMMRRGISRERGVGFEFSSLFVRRMLGQKFLLQVGVPVVLDFIVCSSR